MQQASYMKYKRACNRATGHKNLIYRPFDHFYKLWNLFFTHEGKTDFCKWIEEQITLQKQVFVLFFCKVIYAPRKFCRIPNLSTTKILHSLFLASEHSKPHKLKNFPKFEKRTWVGKRRAPVLVKQVPLELVSKLSQPASMLWHQHRLEWGGIFRENSSPRITVSTRLYPT